MVGRSGGRTPRPPLNFYTTNKVKPRVPRGSPSLGHVAPFHSIIKCHVSSPYSTTISQPELATSAARVYLHATSLYGRHISCTAYATSAVRPAQSAPFFFPVWRFEQIAITFAPDVRLRRNELRWVRDVEGYKPICFEAILRTLIFELKFAPWSRF
jgi:hypothetical protein